MARLIPFNRQGVFGLETIDVKVVNNTLTYYFEAHPYVNTPFNGLLLIHLKSTTPAETTADMPVYFETQGMNARRPVMKQGGVPLTAADITVPCYSLFFYDFRTGIVEEVAATATIPS